MNRLNFEVKSVEEKAEGDDLVIHGYVGAFGNVDSYGDVLVKGAAAHQVGETIWAFDGHQKRTGAMQILNEDSHGIFVKTTLPKELESTKEIRALLRVGAPFKMSIGYQTLESDANLSETEKAAGGYRRLMKVKLMEGSLVEFPANDQAVITSVKSEQKISTEAVSELKEIAKLLGAAFVVKRR